TIGAANDVPRTTANVGDSSAAAMSAPGAANFTCLPRQASSSTFRCASTPVTPTTSGYDAGYNGAAAGPSFPTAATMMCPRAIASRTTFSSSTFFGPTRLTLMTATCWRASHAMASTTASAAPPVPSPQYTSAANNSAPGAAPVKGSAFPTSSEATAVPCALGTALPSQPY